MAKDMDSGTAKARGLPQWFSRVEMATEPDFIKESILTLQQYVDWADEPTSSEHPWAELPLIRSEELMTLSRDAIERRFPELRSYLQQVRREAEALLRERLAQPDGAWIAALQRVKGGDRGAGHSGFLTDCLLNLQLERFDALDADAFAIGARMTLFDWTLTVDERELEGLRESHELLEHMDLTDVLSAVDAIDIPDAERMALMRLMLDIPGHLPVLVELLKQLEAICRAAFPLIEDAYRRQIERVAASGMSGLTMLLEYHPVQLDDYRPEDTIRLQLLIAFYNGLGMQLNVWRDRVPEIHFGLYIEELVALVDHGRDRERRLERQLATLADHTRYRIVMRLADAPAYVQLLADELGLSAATVSHHMTQLHDARIVEVEVVGRRGYYHLQADTLTDLAEHVGQLAARARTLATRRAEPDADRSQA